MALRTEPQWKTFLLDAGIPDAEATTYAKKFVDNRITELSIPEMTKEILQELEIAVLGDRMAILAHSKTFGTTPAPVAAQHAYRASSNVEPHIHSFGKCVPIGLYTRNCAISLLI